MVDAAGTNKYTYTIAGRLFTEDGPWANDTVTNFYNNGMRTNLALGQPLGTWTNGFGYDAAKRLTSVASPAGTFTYTYLNGASRLTQKLALPNTSYITNNYDGNARLLFTKLLTSSSSLLDSSSYGYNAGNQRVTITNSVNWSTNRYDNIGQLSVVDSSSNTEDRGYKYDTAWNLSYRTNNGTLQTFNVDGKNQLTTSPPGTASYDSNGNMLGDGSYDNNYTYDDENQLVQRLDGNGEFRWNYVYDGQGRLRRKFLEQEGGGWSTVEDVIYIYDGMRVIQERDNSAGTPTVSYTRGSDLSGSLEGAGGIGGLLARSSDFNGRTKAWDTSLFYHADGNGNLTYLETSAQGLGASYRYDAYGNTLASSGSYAGANTYRFSSKMIDADSGLYYYGYRWYAPNLQRWVNRDPYGEIGFHILRGSSIDALMHITHLFQHQAGPNAYPFVRSNPLNSTDAYGLISQNDPGIRVPCTAGMNVACLIYCSVKYGQIGGCVAYLRESSTGQIHLDVYCSCYPCPWN
jgi:RHS repeat-associated protein